MCHGNKNSLIIIVEIQHHKFCTMLVKPIEQISSADIVTTHLSVSVSIRGFATAVAASLVSTLSLSFNLHRSQQLDDKSLIHALSTH